MSKQKYYSIRSYGSYMARYKLRFSVVLFWFIFSNACLAILPIFIGKLVGTLTAVEINRHQVMVYVGVLIACSVVHDNSWRLCEYLFIKMIKPIGFMYENVIFRQIIRKPYPYFVDKFTGKVSAYIDTLSSELKTLIDRICFDYVNLIIRLVSVGVILTVINWYTGLIFAVSVVLMFIVGRLTIRNNVKYEKVFADVQSNKTGKIVDAIANFVNVKSFQKENDEIVAIETEQNITMAANRKAFMWGILFWGSMGAIVRSIIWPATIILNVYLFLHGKLSIAELTTLLTAILLFSDFIWMIVWHVSEFSIKLAHIEEAHTYLFGHTNIVHSNFHQKEFALQNHKFTKTLKLMNLDFAYPDKSEVGVLTDLNITLHKGDKIGIVGKSGSGKSTLTKILLGYYPAVTGNILLDDKPIDTRNLSQLISYVPQDTSLFHRSIADNIMYATDKNVTRSDVIIAAKRAHADEFISQISDGYDALVGERGVKLSAGQRQRIAIARAFLDDKPILILDEATSALDSESEVLVQQALELLWQHKTVIAIAHRLSTLRHMDKIIVMDRGRIVESGSHEALIKQKGKYAKLWAHQSGGFLDE